jgi:CHAT domain-containing protein/tetratricopeptide (TPR) repeat protein
MNDEHMDELSLLAICAILRHFDQSELSMLAQIHEHQAAKFLASDPVIPMQDAPSRYQLRDDLRAPILERLRDERPTAEVELHTRAFHYYLDKLRHSDRSPDAEDGCLHHLDALFLLVGAQMNWRTIREYTSAVRTTSPQQLRHQQRLSLYDGYVAIRMQEYDHGETILFQLLQQEIIDPDVRLKTLKGLADSASARSRYDEALALYRQLEQLASETGEQAYQGLALLNIALVYHSLSQYDLAFEHCDRSLRLFRTQRDRLREGYALYHCGLYSTYLGRWAPAEQYIDAAATLFERLGLPNYLGFVYWQKGYIHHIFGDELAAENSYRRALPLAESPQFGQLSLAMDIWWYLGVLYHTQGRWDAALEYYDHALSLATRLDRQHQLCRIHYRRGQAFQQQGRLAEALEAFQAAIDGIETLGSATQGEDVKISLFGTTQQLYEATVLLLLELGRPADAFHYVERARSRAFLDSLAKKSPELSAALARPVVTLADVQAQLPPDALLLEYYTTGVLPRGEHLINSIPDSNTRLRAHLTLPPQVILFAIAHDRFEVLHPALNPNSLRPQIGDRYPGRHLLHGRLPQHLYERLLAPAADLQAGKSTLYLVPHGPLHYVPFTALRSAAGKYLIHSGGPAVAHATSATILMRRCLGRPPTQATGVLTIGFDDPLGEQPLHYAEAEARHVARLLGGEAWTGAEPKSARLIEAGQQLRWLHIAGHARFKPEDPLGSDLYLGQDDALDARAIIRDLTLAADLVTLSSCTSGVTHVVPGDELRGLQRALLFAGAPTVVCTRWEARDLVALLIMDYFYKRLRAGHAPAAALRDAQVAVREMTVQELDTLFESWYATGDELATALGAPAATLQEARAATRELGGPVHSTLLDSLADSPDMRPFADPILWAPFMVVGRA